MIIRNFELVDLDNGTITLIKDDSAFLIKCFRDLIRKDTGMEGDHDGRKKLKSAKELAYIIYINDPIRSPGLRAGYSGMLLHEDAIKQLELPKDWKPSELLLQCEVEYKTYVEGVANNIYRNVLVSMGNINQVVTLLNQRINDYLHGGLTEGDDAEASIDSVIKNITALNKITSEYERSVEELQKAAFKARQERSETIKAKGGKEISNSMDPSQSGMYDN